ncbi:alkaline phosphatase D family protein [Actinophytocola sp. KF-1]
MSNHSESQPIARRTFLGAAGAVALGGLTAGVAGAAAADPFTLGVASGDATSTAVVLWTRLAPAPLDPGSGFGMGGRTEAVVRWRVATTEAGLGADGTSVAHGQVTAVAGQGFAVHVDVTGLAAGRQYHYRFFTTDPDGTTHASPVGRTRTANAASDTGAVRFAVVNCQNVAGGDGEMYFNGARHLADRDDIDFVVFLGDYIYEFGRAAHVPPREITSLDDYRTRYGQYKTRASLRELHRRFPVYVMPDDHEFWNDVRGGDLTSAQYGRFNRALEALWEHMPLRGGRPGAVQPDTQNHLTLYRRIRWGSVLDMFLTDVRQYRGPSLLGATQQNALLEWLRNTTTTWTTIATPTPMWFGPGSGWNAYEGVRRDVTAVLAARKQDTPARFNPVVLSGDIHCGIVTHVRRFTDHSSAFVATEFVNAPMTSQTSGEYGADGEIRRAYNHLNGYMVCTASPTAWTTRYFVGDETALPGGTVTGRPAWQLDAGARVGSVHEL